MAYKASLTIGDESFDLLSYHNHFFYPSPLDKMFHLHMDNFKEIENPIEIFGSMHKYHCWQHNLLAGYDHPSLCSKAYMPYSNLLGGVFTFTIESAGREELFENCVRSRKDDRIPLLHGVLKLYNSSDEYMPFQQMEFWDGFVCRLSESFCSTGSKPMTMQVSISPATIRVNKSIVRQQCWWQKDIYDKGNKAQDKKEPDIIKVYWMDEEEQNIITEINLGQKVIFVAETLDYEPQETLKFTLKDKDTGKVTTLEGETDENGVVKIEWVYEFKD